MTQFNDQRLIKMTKKAFYGSAEFDTDTYGDLDKLFNKETLKDNERNKMLEFLELQTNLARPMSMRAMKLEVFKIIGYKDNTNEYANVLNAAEVKAIYLYLLGQKDVK